MPGRTSTMHATHDLGAHGATCVMDEATRTPPSALGGRMSLVSGMIDDARSAVGVHVDALRHEVDDRVAAVGSKLTTMLIALGVLIVAALLCGLSIAASLVAFGVPLWAALWSVTAVASVLAVAALVRARAKEHRPAPIA